MLGSGGRCDVRWEHPNIQVGIKTAQPRTCGGRAVLLEGGSEFAECLSSEPSTHPLVRSHRHLRDPAVLALHLRRHRHNLYATPRPDTLKSALELWCARLCTRSVPCCRRSCFVDG
eukprot:1195036-Prorocentrum_minimum.AAC.14